MLLVKQLRYPNFNGVGKLNAVVQQITNPNQIRAISAQSLSRANKFETIRPKKFETISASNGLCCNPTSLIQTRSYYQNYKHHPSKIVRAYRKTRNWLTEHFLIGDRRFENLYSFTFLVAFTIFAILAMYLNLQFGGERGYHDIDRTQKKENNEKK